MTTDAASLSCISSRVDRADLSRSTRESRTDRCYRCPCGRQPADAFSVDGLRSSHGAESEPCYPICPSPHSLPRASRSDRCFRCPCRRQPADAFSVDRLRSSQGAESGSPCYPICPSPHSPSFARRRGRVLRRRGLGAAARAVRSQSAWVSLPSMRAIQMRRPTPHRSPVSLHSLIAQTCRGQPGSRELIDATGARAAVNQPTPSRLMAFGHLMEPKASQCYPICPSPHSLPRASRSDRCFRCPCRRQPADAFSVDRLRSSQGAESDSPCYPICPSPHSLTSFAHLIRPHSLVVEGAFHGDADWARQRVAVRSQSAWVSLPSMRAIQMRRPTPHRSPESLHALIAQT